MSATVMRAIRITEDLALKGSGRREKVGRVENVRNVERVEWLDG